MKIDQKKIKNFWDERAGIYDEASLTDNEGELDILSDICEELWLSGDKLNVTTYGGATGLRDPIFLIETLINMKVEVESIFFNDISSEMVVLAERNIKNKFPLSDCSTFTGDIEEAIDTNPNEPGCLMLGVYNIDSLAPQDSSEYSALDMYMQSNKLGSAFKIHALDFSDEDSLSEDKVLWSCSIEEYQKNKDENKKTFLDICNKQKNGVMVLSEDDNGDTIFSSCWYRKDFLFNLAKSFFSEEKYFIKQYEKGRSLVVSICPNKGISNVTTIINNTFGNLSVDKQKRVLQKLTRG